ncbi:unnamed protein product [Hermetia illucens]|uniref:Peptidase S1 domain-containing protein n=1 Tax=Hermetia illucens TaxID=343691 RepID=A0A7R8V1T0_HERIL|nr:anionic trypsin-1-like [Hermetia illucens]CAD7091163.1 unnamed protein product [Hermetia illucens]
MKSIVLSIFLTFLLGTAAIEEFKRSNTTHKRFYNIIVQRNPDSATRDLMCSGALISYNKVLTVAHCFFNSSRYSVPKENFAVMLGELGNAAKETRLIQIENILIHPEYSYDNDRQNDLAVVILREEVETDAEDIIPIGIATFALPLNTECIITTWLSLLWGWSLTERIQKIPVTVVDTGNCSAGAILSDRTICVYGNETELEGTYFLSGTPLICNNILAGLSSQTIRSSIPISLESFTNISFYSFWITNNATKRFYFVYIWMYLLASIKFVL